MKRDLLQLVVAMFFIDRRISKRGHTMKSFAQFTAGNPHAPKVLECDRVPVLAAVLPLAQSRSISGAEMLRAYIVGVEVATSLAESLEPDRLLAGFPVTRISGGIGALFASATVLGLTTQQ